MFYAPEIMNHLDLSSTQWHGNYFRTGGQDPKPSTRNTVLRWNWIAYCPKYQRSLKKKKKKGYHWNWGVCCWPKIQRFLNKKKISLIKSSPERFLSQIWPRIKGLRGGKSRPEGAKISPGGGQLPPPLPAPMQALKHNIF